VPSLVEVHLSPYQGVVPWTAAAHHVLQSLQAVVPLTVVAHHALQLLQVEVPCSAACQAATNPRPRLKVMPSKVAVPYRKAVRLSLEAVPWIVVVHHANLQRQEVGPWTAVVHHAVASLQRLEVAP